MARSMDCRRTSAADRACDCGEGVQWPNERKPIFFMQYKSPISTVSLCNASIQKRYGKFEKRHLLLWVVMRSENFAVAFWRCHAANTPHATWTASHLISVFSSPAGSP